MAVWTTKPHRNSSPVINQWTEFLTMSAKSSFLVSHQAHFGNSLLYDHVHIMVTGIHSVTDIPDLIQKRNAVS